MTRALIVVLMLLPVAPAGAADTGLALIPTADTLAPRQYRVEYQAQGPWPIVGGVGDEQVQSEFGLGLGEIGVDYDLPRGAEAGALLNAKLVLRPTSERVGLALGVLNIGEHQMRIDYVVMSMRPVPRTQVSVGMQRTGAGVNEGFAGIAQSLSSTLQVYAETIAGAENASAVSLAYQVSNPLGVLLTWQRFHDGSGNGFLFDVNYTGSF